MTAMELVTGATGYIGGRLIDRLLAEGRAVRALTREPQRFETRTGVEAARGDVITGAGLRDALDGCSAAYYLVHSMEASAGGRSQRGMFPERERRGAESFAAAAQDAGVERVVYLSGLVPSGGAASAHIASRLEVENILLEAAPTPTVLRASLVIGAGSSSFRMLVRLVERLRLLPLPPWRGSRTQPIAERDAIEYLARTPSLPATAGRSLDIAGLDVLSYGEMIARIADHLGVGRMPINLRASLTPPASAVVSAVTGQPIELVRPLMESLERDLLPREGHEAEAVYGIRPLGFDRAVERALAEWERHEELAAR